MVDIVVLKKSSEAAVGSHKYGSEIIWVMWTQLLTLPYLVGDNSELQLLSNIVPAKLDFLKKACLSRNGVTVVTDVPYQYRVGHKAPYFLKSKVGGVVTHQNNKGQIIEDGNDMFSAVLKYLKSIPGIEQDVEEILECSEAIWSWFVSEITSDEVEIAKCKNRIYERYEPQIIEVLRMRAEESFVYIKD
jgi:hypothetical protein